MFQELIKVNGKLSITVTNPQNKVTNRIEMNNLVVNTGKAWIASRLKSTGIPSEMSFMAIGHDPTISTELVIPPTVNNTALIGEKSRVALSISGGTVSHNKIVYTGVFGPNVGIGDISEAGIFNAVTNGTMLCRTTFFPLTKSVTDTFTIVWEVTIT